MKTIVLPAALALLSIALAGFAAAQIASPAKAAQREQRPNIIVILADDMGYSDIGPYGAEIQTPHLDRLAAGGLRFSQFYNNPRCCPTRVSLMTGLYPPQTGIPHMVNTSHLPQHQRDLSRNVVTIAEVLRSAGYQTAMSGKWHLTPVPDEPPDENGKLFALPVTADTDKSNWPLQRGFDRFYGIIHAIGNFFDPVTLTSGNDPISPHGRDYYITHAISDNAVKFLKEMEGNEQPFFLYTAYTAPHWPLHAPAEYVAKYKDIYRRGWDRIRAERFRRLQGTGLLGVDWKLSAKDPTAHAWETVEHADWEAHRMAVHAAMIERMDHGVGRIVAELERQNRLDNTLILFLSDNGASAEELGPRPPVHSWGPATAPGGGKMRFGNNPGIYPGPADTWTSYGRAWANVSVTPFRASKGWTHEGGIATPLIAYWQRTINKGRISHDVGHVMDIMATCVDLAGATYPQVFAGNKIVPLEGISLAPVFENKALADRTLVWEHNGNRAVRQGKWKIVSRYAQPWELYDMEADRTETIDLAERGSDKVKELAPLYDAWASRVGVLPWETVEPSEKERRLKVTADGWPAVASTTVELSEERRRLGALRSPEPHKQEAAPAFDFLSDLPWSKTENILSGPHKDRSGWDPHAKPPGGGYKPIEIAGARFDNGLSWFPDKNTMSFVEWDLKRDYKRLTFKVRIDDEKHKQSEWVLLRRRDGQILNEAATARPLLPGRRFGSPEQDDYRPGESLIRVGGGASLAIYGDGRLLAKTREFYAHGDPEEIDVDVSGVKRLRLELDPVHHELAEAPYRHGLTLTPLLTRMRWHDLVDVAEPKLWR